MHKRCFRVFLSPLHQARAVALYRENRRSRSRYRHSLDWQKLPLQSLQFAAHLLYGMQIRTPKKGEDVPCVMERRISIQKQPIGSICTVQLMNCEGHKLAVFFLILIFLMGAEVIAITL